MEVKNCKECGRLFNYIGGQRLCPACKSKLEDKFVEVKKYIDENKSAQIQDIAENNDVTVQQIKQWIREERLVFTDESVVGIECENCGATIKTGRYCEKCNKDLANNLGNSIRRPIMEEPKKDPRERA